MRKPDDSTKHPGGRPRVYQSNADRQRAYRERMRTLRNSQQTKPFDAKQERVTKLRPDSVTKPPATAKQQAAPGVTKPSPGYRGNGEGEQKAAAHARYAAELEDWAAQIRENLAALFHDNPRVQALNILGLGQMASQAAIKTRYRELVKKHHPDAGGKHADFIRIKQAYEVLKGRTP